MSDLIPIGNISEETFHGRSKVAEPEDPYTPTAVALSTPGYDGTTAMARTFIEEFALMGWSHGQVRRMFENPRYVGTNQALRECGAEAIEQLITDVMGSEPKEA